jgi:hypothetical protein
MSSKRRFAEQVLVPLLLAVGTAVLLALLYFLHEYGQTQEPGTAQQYQFSNDQLQEYAHFTGAQVALLAGLLLSLLTALWLKKRVLYTQALLLSAGYLVQLLMR